MPARRLTLLIVDDDVDYAAMLARTLGVDFDVAVAHNADEAHRRLQFSVDVVLLDLRLKDNDDQEDRSGMMLLEALRETRPIPVVIMTAYADVDVAVEAMKLGAADFIQKSRLDVVQLRKMLFNSIERVHLRRKVDEFERREAWELIGDTKRMNDLRRIIETVAEDGYATVLVRGETGTGKEMVAKAIHRRGIRKNAPFKPVALVGIASTLIESELFGHVRGAFTDARTNRPGWIQDASGGILFLDEIGDVGRDVQPKLLRFLDTRRFTPVGSTKEVSVDVQIVCATNRNLEEAVQSGEFRQDLYYRLRTIEIVLPPLRERLEDVPLLVDHFLFQFRKQGRTRAAGITAAALDRLCRYSYPGNVRELNTCILEHAMMMASLHGHVMIDIDDLPANVTSAAPLVRVPGPDDQIDLDGELARAELTCIERALQVTEGHKSEASRILGLNDRFALLRRVKRIRDEYPDLLNDYPTLRDCYVESAERLA